MPLGTCRGTGLTSAVSLRRGRTVRAAHGERVRGMWCCLAGARDWMGARGDLCSTDHLSSLSGLSTAHPFFVFRFWTSGPQPHHSVDNRDSCVIVLWSMLFGFVVREVFRKACIYYVTRRALDGLTPFECRTWLVHTGGVLCMTVRDGPNSGHFGFTSYQLKLLTSGAGDLDW